MTSDPCYTQMLFIIYKSTLFPALMFKYRLRHDSPYIYIFHPDNLTMATRFNTLAAFPLARICVWGPPSGSGWVAPNTIFLFLCLTDGDGREICILLSYNNVRYIVHKADQFRILCAGAALGTNRPI